MFRLSLIFSHSLVKLFVLRLQTLTPILDLILLLMASGVEGLRVLSLMLGSSTLVHHQTVHLKSAYHRHEKGKRRQYEQRVCEVEHSHFTPLVFITTGGMSDAASQVYKRLANLLCDKLDLSYGEVMVGLDAN